MQISPQYSLIVGDFRLAPTHATSGVRKTSTLSVDFISSESRVFTLYARSISIISTAGTV